MKEIEPPIQLIWMVFLGANLVQLGWKGRILCLLWTNFGPFHREDGRILPPWKGFSVLPSNSKSDACPERSRRALSIELRVRGEVIIPHTHIQPADSQADTADRSCWR